MDHHDAYTVGLFITWAARVVLITSLLAFLAFAGSGCSHVLDLSSKGSLSKDNPSSTNTIVN
jgi:hypothetical protein